MKKRMLISCVLMMGLSACFIVPPDRGDHEREQGHRDHQGDRGDHGGNDSGRARDHDREHGADH